MSLLTHALRESVNTEVSRIRKGDGETPLPLSIAFVGGDFNMSARNAPFKKATEREFLPVLSSAPKTSLSRTKRELSQPYDNVFLKVRGPLVHVNSSRVINLYREFPNLEIDTIYNNISDHCPIRVDVDLNPPPRNRE